MFASNRPALTGAQFDKRFADLSNVARTNYVQLDTLAALLYPNKWDDQLSPSQRLRFTFVSSMQTWTKIALTFSFALDKVPVLTLAVHCARGVCRYLSLAVYDDHVVTFSLDALSQMRQTLRRGELLPQQVRDWLRDERIYVVIAGDPIHIPEGVTVNNLVSTRDIYLLYQRKGIIAPVVRTADGDLKEQLAYAHAYHHRPSTPAALEHLLGGNEYRHWPEHRRPGWKPVSVVELKPREEFFLFYEAAGPLAFIYRLLRHGIIYDDMKTVCAQYNLSDILTTFLRGSGQLDAAREQDPLGLHSEHDMGTGLSRHALLQQGPTASATPLLPDVHAAVSASSGDRALEGGPASLREDETLEISDPVLEKELQSEEGDNSPQEQAAVSVAVDVHPGYFTSAGAAAAGASGAAATASAETHADDVDPAGSRAAGAGGGRGRSTWAEEVDRMQEEECVAPPRRPGPPRPDTPAARMWAASRAGRERLQQAGPPPRKQQALSRPAPPRGDSRAAQAFGGYDLRQHIAARTIRHDPAEARYDTQDLRARLNVRCGALEYRGQAEAEDHRAAPLSADVNVRFQRRVKRKAEQDDREREEDARPPSDEEGGEQKMPAIERDDPSNLFLTEEEKLYNPFAMKPSFHGRCTFCSGGHCSRSNRAGTMSNCLKLRTHQQLSHTRNICSYARCPDPTDHHTVVCPALHGKCPICGCRGHSERDACRADNAGNMSRLRFDFEDVAGLGFHTKKRHRQLAWGFYPLPSTCPEDTKMVSYTELTRMDVLPAIKLVRDLALLPENVGESPRAVVPPADALLGRARLHAPTEAGRETVAQQDGNNNKTTHPHHR